MNHLVALALFLALAACTLAPASLTSSPYHGPTEAETASAGGGAGGGGGGGAGGM